jgi:serralysin
MAGFKTVLGSGYGNAYTDSLIWGGRIWDTSTGPIKVALGEGYLNYFDAHYKEAVQVHGPGYYMDPEAMRYLWYTEEAEAMSYVLALYASVANIEFTSASSLSEANIVWWKTDLPSGALGIHETPDLDPDENFVSYQRWGYFDPRNYASWQELGFGGDGLNTLIHEVGHGLGLAHPHDGGVRFDSTVFPGVAPGSSLGTHGLNQSVYTVMSYNPGLSTVPATLAYGTQGGLGAFDIAALQQIYGANLTSATGNDVYVLPKQNARGTGWSGIWDAGGIDTISGVNSTTSVVIDLRAATLVSNDPHAGGFISQQKGIAGGFTIAKSVVIENAIGGSGGDTLIGNRAANRLTGNAGNDVLNGGAGADIMIGGTGNDTYYVDSADDRGIETSTGGTDTVVTTISHTLAAYVENLVASGTAGITLTGNTLNNVIKGNSGANKIYGGAGNDVLTGGAGRDVFMFNTKPGRWTNLDTITDFSAVDDTMRLDNAIFTKLGAGTSTAPLTLNSAFFKLGAVAKDANDYILYDQATGYLRYDADGSGAAAAVVFAKLANKPALTHWDFQVV